MKLKCLLISVVIYTPHYMGNSLNSCFKKLSLGLFLLILMDIFIGILPSKVACICLLLIQTPLLYSSYLYLQSSLGLFFIPIFLISCSPLSSKSVLYFIETALLIVFNDSTANSIQIFQELILHFFFLSVISSGFYSKCKS